MTDEGTRRAVPAFVLAVTVAGAGSLAVTLGTTWHRGFGDLRLLALSVAALAVVSTFPIVFAWKGSSESVNLEEAFFALLVLTAPPAAVVTAMLFATLYTNAYQRRPLLKTAFNLGLFSVSVSAALAVTHLVAGGVPAGAGWRGVAGALAGVLTLYVSTTLGVRAIVAVADRLPFRALFAGMSTTELVIISSSASLGVLAGLAAVAQPLSMVFLFPPLAVIAFVLHQHARAVQGRQQLDRLLQTAVAASQAVSSAGVRDVLVEAAGSLLHSAEARLQLAPPLHDELGSRVQAEDRGLWLVARPRRTDPRSRTEGQTLLDGIAAIGSGALESAELLDRVSHQAFHDNLTGLPNRVLFEDRVKQALRGRDREAVAVLFVDLDLFKRVNDSLGHGAGDDLLKQVADRLRVTLRASDSVARVGGDEFAVLLPQAGGSVALEVAGRINQAMRQPFQVEEQELTVTVSVGVALSPADGDDYESLLRSADQAMYDAKAGGRDGVRRAATRTPRSGRLTLEAELRHAIQHRELWVAYQPQIDLASGRIVGTEALVRWAHPTRGQMRPDAFLPLAEELGLLGAIDAWVMAEACRQTAAWRAGGLADLRISVNLSAGPLRSETLHDDVLSTLRRTGIPTTALEIEVTEQVAGTEGEVGLEALARLRRRGVRVAIDDFGTGYSSLSRLRTLPVDVVKIDRSFIGEILDPSSAVPLVTNTISMAHGLGLEVVAEGIETSHQLAFLTAAGCQTGQGYLFGRPVAASDLRPDRPLWTPPADPVSAG